jgi:hypothetical protein
VIDHLGKDEVRLSFCRKLKLDPLCLLRSAIINIKRSKAVRYWEFHYSINYSMMSIVSIYRTGLKRREI